MKKVGGWGGGGGGWGWTVAVGLRGRGVLGGTNLGLMEREGGADLEPQALSL